MGAGLNLSSNAIEAFHAVASSLSFSKAAASLHLTQSAVSQRIAQLEDGLGLSLFVRKSKSIALTEAGEMFLGFCRSQKTLEDEVLAQLTAAKTGALSGSIRVGAYSSILRSAVIPALTPFLRDNPKVEIEFRSFSTQEIAFALQNDEVDIVLTDFALHKGNVHSEILGHESFVVIESAVALGVQDVFLDNAPSDLATENFFRGQPTGVPKYTRLFMHDCYGIIDGVIAGLGRAVMPAHLLKGNDKVRILDGYQPYLLQVCMQFFTQTRYSRLHLAVSDLLRGRVRGFL